MREEKIRPIAICVCRAGERILVAEGYDSVKEQIFYRPLGGSIEFGERGEEAVRREFQEEIGTGLDDIRYLGFWRISLFAKGNAATRSCWYMMGGWRMAVCMKKRCSGGMNWAHHSRRSGCG